jgi:hypothetical protein
MSRKQQEARAGGASSSKIILPTDQRGSSLLANNQPHRNRAIRIGQRMAKYAERGEDLYETPRSAVKVLLDAELLLDDIWEPAVGRGNIVRVLREAGHRVVASDLVDHGNHVASGIRTGINFLKTTSVPPGVRTLVTNPPFKKKLAERFVRHALELGVRRIIIFQKIQFLGSENRPDIFRNCPQFARVHIFEKRPVLHRDGFPEEKRNTPWMVCAWFVWDQKFVGNGEPTMHWIPAAKLRRLMAHDKQTVSGGAAADAAGSGD